jgi:hypothetical protein
LPSIFAQDSEAGERHSKPTTNWLDGLIGPGGLLLVVSHLLRMICNLPCVKEYKLLIPNAMVKFPKIPNFLMFHTLSNSARNMHKVDVEWFKEHLKISQPEFSSSCVECPSHSIFLLHILAGMLC